MTAIEKIAEIREIVERDAIALDVRYPLAVNASFGIDVVGAGRVWIMDDEGALDVYAFTETGVVRWSASFSVDAPAAVVAETLLVAIR